MIDDLPIPAELALAEGEDAPPSDEEVDIYLDGVEIGSTIGTAYRSVAAFRLDSDSHAEYYLRRLAETGRELAAITAQADEWKARIDAWVEQQTAPVERRRGWWRAHLEDYAIRRRAERLAADPKDSRAKSLVLPSGTVSTTHRRPVAKIADPARVVEWLRARAVAENVDAVDEGWLVVETKPVAAAVKRMVYLKGNDEDGYAAIYAGEVVPGVAVEGETVTATVQANGGGK